PDGCIEMIFILGDDVKRYTSEEAYILQPRTMVLGQISEPFFVEPTGVVHSFAIRFYPYGFANFTSIPIKALANKETPLGLLLGEKIAGDLEHGIVHAVNTAERIAIMDDFFLHKLKEDMIVDNILKSTVDMMLSDKGNITTSSLIKGELSKRQQLERNSEERR